jgi:hypothetical protein
VTSKMQQVRRMLEMHQENEKEQARERQQGAG